MPRTARASVGGLWYHVLNRGNRRAEVFHKPWDYDLQTVLRYVERNALRAELVARAEDWKWSSLPLWLRRDPLLWDGKPKVRDKSWLARVNMPLSGGDLQRLRLSAERGRPFGDESWTRETARNLGLDSTLRSRGRPRKKS
jgi:putative transposase